MSDSLRTMHYCLVGIFTLLVLATIILFILRKFRPQYDWFELQQRINSWWIIVGLFSLAMLSPKEVALAFWGFLSFLSLKEYLTLTPTRRSDSIPLLWMYVAIPLQYIWVGMSWYGMFIIFIPVYVFLFLPVRMVLVGDTRSFFTLGIHSAVGDDDNGLCFKSCCVPDDVARRECQCGGTTGDISGGDHRT